MLLCVDTVLSSCQAPRDAMPRAPAAHVPATGADWDPVVIEQDHATNVVVVHTAKAIPDVGLSTSLHGGSHPLPGGAASAWLLGKQVEELLGKGVPYADISRALSDENKDVLFLAADTLLVVHRGPGRPLDGQHAWVVRLARRAPRSS